MTIGHKAAIAKRPCIALLLLGVSLGAVSCVNSGGPELASVDPNTDGQGTTSLAVVESRDGKIRVVKELPPPAESLEGTLQPIAKNDVIAVDVFQVDDLDRTVEVDARGLINLPLIGDVEAAGKSTRQLETEIEKRYALDYLQSPQVSVFVKESVGQRVTVDGEVKKAGIVPITTSTTLLDIVAQAGGLTELADPAKVYVFRQIGAEKLVANYDVKNIREGKRSNPKIYGGDTVVVFSSATKVAMRNLKDALGVAAGVARIVP